MIAKSPAGSRSRKGSKASAKASSSSSGRRSCGLSEAVRVVVRCRPLIKRQVSAKEKAIVQCVDGVSVSLPGSKKFAFDRVFDESTKQPEVYEKTAAPLVAAALDGYNGTVFAYGQTGSGKTFTMDGEKGDLGIMRRAFSEIFEGIEKVHQSGKQSTFLVRASFVQIYQEQVYDLLIAQDKSEFPMACPSPVGVQALEVREDPRHGFFIQGVTNKVVRNAAQCVAALDKGTLKRVTAETAMNAQSSRSHTVFSVTIEREDIVDGPKPETVTSCGVVNFVDLAGSENLGRSKSEGLRRDEACYINSSLTALNNTIRALVSNARSSKQTHVPYRDSTLTKILRESLGGTARCVMVANISPSEKDLDETASTLWHAHSAKEIQNKPTRHTGVSSISRYKLQIASLKEQLARENSENELRISELTEALMVPTLVESLAERWSSEASRDSGLASEREAQLGAQVQSMAAQIEQLQQQLGVANARCASENVKLERDLVDAKQEIQYLRTLNNEQSVLLAKMESEHLGLLAQNQKLLDRTWREQQPGAQPGVDSLCLEATEQQLQQALSTLESSRAECEHKEQRVRQVLGELSSEREQVGVLEAQLQAQAQQTQHSHTERESEQEQQRQTLELLSSAQQQQRDSEHQLQQAVGSLQSQRRHVEQAEALLKQQQQAQQQLSTSLREMSKDKEHTEQQLLQALSKLESEVKRRKQAEEMQHTRTKQLEHESSLTQEHTSQQLKQVLSALESEKKGAKQTEKQLQQALTRLETEVQHKQRVGQQLHKLQEQAAAAKSAEQLADRTPLQPRDNQHTAEQDGWNHRFLLCQNGTLADTENHSARNDAQRPSTASSGAPSSFKPSFNPISDSFQHKDSTHLSSRADNFQHKDSTHLSSRADNFQHKDSTHLSSRADNFQHKDSTHLSSRADSFQHKDSTHADSFQHSSKPSNSHRFFEQELRKAVEAEMHGITHLLKTELRSDLDSRSLM